VATLLLLMKNRDRLQEPRTTATYGFLYHQFKYFLLPLAAVNTGRLRAGHLMLVLV
jgi:hypothetical protein